MLEWAEENDDLKKKKRKPREHLVTFFSIKYLTHTPTPICNLNSQQVAMFQYFLSGTIVLIRVVVSEKLPLYMVMYRKIKERKQTIVCLLAILKKKIYHELYLGERGCKQPNLVGFFLPRVQVSLLAF